MKHGIYNHWRDFSHALNLRFRVDIQFNYDIWHERNSGKRVGTEVSAHLT